MEKKKIFPVRKMPGRNYTDLNLAIRIFFFSHLVQGWNAESKHIPDVPAKEGKKPHQKQKMGKVWEM